MDKNQRHDEKLAFRVYAVPSGPVQIPASRMLAVLGAAGIAFAGVLLWPTDDASQPSQQAQPAIETQQQPAAPAPVVAPTAGAPQAVVGPIAPPNMSDLARQIRESAEQTPGQALQQGIDQCAAQGNTGTVVVPMISNKPMSCENLKHKPTWPGSEDIGGSLFGGSLRIFGDAPRGASAPPPEEPVPWREIALGGAAGAAMLGLLAWAWTLRRRAAVRRELLAEADEIRDTVETEYLTYLATATDRLFKRPLLDQLTEPLTVAFIDAREKMNDLHEQLDRSNAAAVGGYVDAVQDCHHAWTAAAEHADEIGLGTMEPGVAEKLQKAQNLLEVALDQSVTSAERSNAIDKTATILAAITGRAKDVVKNEVATAVGEEQLAIEAAAPQLAIAAAPHTSDVPVFLSGYSLGAQHSGEILHSLSEPR